MYNQKYFQSNFLNITILWSVLILLFTLTVDGRLVSVVVIFRHGARSPIQSYLHDPYRNLSFWPNGLGQLTNKGKYQEYELGQWLRQRYNKFLSVVYNRSEIYVRSTDFDRTLMSAQLVLAGLYPVTKEQEWHPNLKWQPIPVHTVPLSHERLLLIQNNCKHFNTLYQELLSNSAKFSQINHKNDKLYKYLRYHSGINVQTVAEVNDLYNILQVEEEHNYLLPAWTNSVYPDKLAPLAYLYMASHCETPYMTQLKTGIFYSKLLKFFKHRVTKRKHQKKFRLFAAHDRTLVDFLTALGAYDRLHSPPYGSALIFEQRYNRKMDHHYVLIYYKNSTKALKITMRGSQFKCPLYTFEKKMSNICMTHDQWVRECHNDVTEEFDDLF